MMPYSHKKLPSRDATLILLQRRRRAAERADREPRRTVTPTCCLGCGASTDQLSIGAVCHDCSDSRDLVGLR